MTLYMIQNFIKKLEKVRFPKSRFSFFRFQRKCVRMYQLSEEKKLTI
jgi:hypothetical protein